MLHWFLNQGFLNKNIKWKPDNASLGHTAIFSCVHFKCNISICITMTTLEHVFAIYMFI